MSHKSRDDLELELAFGELVRSSEQDADKMTNPSEYRPQITTKARGKKRVVQPRHNPVSFWYGTKMGNRYREFHL